MRAVISSELQDADAQQRRWGGEGGTSTAARGGEDNSNGNSYINPGYFDLWRATNPYGGGGGSGGGDGSVAPSLGPILGQYASIFGDRTAAGCTTAAAGAVATTCGMVIERSPRR
ncbi:hypothetical protein ACHAW5_010716 [Stephanodiscus triporus]